MMSESERLLIELYGILQVAPASFCLKKPGIVRMQKHPSRQEKITNKIIRFNRG